MTTNMNAVITTPISRREISLTVTKTHFPAKCPMVCWDTTKVALPMNIAFIENLFNYINICALARQRAAQSRPCSASQFWRAAASMACSIAVLRSECQRAA